MANTRRPKNAQAAMIKEAAVNEDGVDRWRCALPWSPFLSGWSFLAATALALILSLSAAERRNEPKPATSQPADPVRQVELRARVVCLAEEMHRLHEAGLPTKHEHLWGLKAEDGKFYTLLRTKFSEAIFLDEQIRTKQLAIKAKLFPNTQILEVENIRSVRNGVVYDLYYYCDVCTIKAVSPEPCVCCQGPVELVEKPLGQEIE